MSGVTNPNSHLKEVVWGLTGPEAALEWTKA